MYRDEGESPDGSRYEMVAWRVPGSEDYPEGPKYSFQYTGADGDTLLRCDNAPYHLDVGRHHRHTPEGDITPAASISSVVATLFGSSLAHWLTRTGGAVTKMVLAAVQES